MTDGAAILFAVAVIFVGVWILLIHAHNEHDAEFGYGASFEDCCDCACECDQPPCCDCHA